MPYEEGRQQFMARFHASGRVARDVAAISDGTLASMTREVRVDVLSAIQHTWLAWHLNQEESGAKYCSWQESWQAWLQEME